MMTVLFAASVVGCASTPAAGPSGPTAAAYAPVPVGASWTYEAEFQGHKEDVTAQLVSEKDGYVVDNRNGAFRHTPDGFRDRERYLIRHPLVAGTKWKAVTGPSAVEHMEITSVGAPCESVAGKFDDCVVVNGRLRRDKTMAMTIEWTWARGVGLVKVRTAAEIKGKKSVPQSTMSLKSYSLKPAKGQAAPAKAAPAKTGAVPATPAGGDDGPDTWTSE